jgi:hypothetical protein
MTRYKDQKNIVSKLADVAIELKREMSHILFRLETLEQCNLKIRDDDRNSDFDGQCCLIAQSLAEIETRTDWIKDNINNLFHILDAEKGNEK